MGQPHPELQVGTTEHVAQGLYSKPCFSFLGAGDLTGQPGVASPPPLLEETPHRTQQEWSYLFGGEEQEMQAMVEELLTLFPSSTTESESATLPTIQFRSLVKIL